MVWILTLALCLPAGYAFARAYAASIAGRLAPVPVAARDALAR
jgi:hypothetical protein